MTESGRATATVTSLDVGTAALVRLSAAIAAGSEAAIRDALAVAMGDAESGAVEEVILQSYLFAGFPRALNAAREWRRISGRPAPQTDVDEASDAEEYRERGEKTCAVVYGRFYEQLRRNIRALHPALDDWMIVDGYGKVLSRPGLDLRTRELCIVAACAAAEQDRQLHSHLHGALHAGATTEEVTGTLELVGATLSPDASRRYALLWARVRER